MQRWKTEVLETNLGPLFQMRTYFFEEADSV